MDIGQGRLEILVAGAADLRNRGVKDVFLACVDGLKGFPQAIESVFPHAQVQLCIVHLTRASLNYVSWKERKAVAPGSEGDLSGGTVELPSTNSTPFLRNGMRAIQRSVRYGSGTGNRSSRSSPTRPRFAASSTPRMRWNL